MVYGVWCRVQLFFEQGVGCWTEGCLFHGAGRGVDALAQEAGARAQLVAALLVVLVLGPRPCGDRLRPFQPLLRSTGSHLSLTLWF